MGNTLAISPLFSNWVEEKTGAATISFNNGGVNISAAAGETATVYYPIVVYPGDTVEFTVDVFTSSIAGKVFLMEGSPGSGFGNIATVETTRGMQSVSVKHTVSMDSNIPIYVFAKVGLDSTAAGSLTAVNPRIRILSGSIGSSRTIAMGNLIVNGGAVTINDKWAHSGIASVAINAGLVEITLDEVAPTAPLSYHTKALPHFSVSTGFGTASNLICRPKSYDQYTRVFGVEFIDMTTGTQVDAATVSSARLLFKAELI